MWLLSPWIATRSSSMDRKSGLKSSICAALQFPTQLTLNAHRVAGNHSYSRFRSKQCQQGMTNLKINSKEGNTTPYTWVPQPHEWRPVARSGQPPTAPKMSPIKKFSNPFLLVFWETRSHNLMENYFGIANLMWFSMKSHPKLDCGASETLRKRAVDDPEVAVSILGNLLRSSLRTLEGTWGS